MQAFPKPRSIPLLVAAALLAALQTHLEARAFGALSSSTHRHLHVLALSRPEEQEGGSTIVHVMLHVGINPITEVGEPSQQIFRWTKAPRGHTPSTSCSGEADNEIGVLANRLMGVYEAQNAPPGVPLPGRAVTAIVWGVHKLFNTPYNPSVLPPFPKLYQIATYETNLQNRHYNSIEYGGNNPPWNCLNNQEIIGFANDNIFLGNDVRTKKPEVLMVKINGVSFERKLVCTRVIGFAGQESGENGTMKYQEHLTEHYFGVVAFIDSIPFPISEM